MKFPDGIRTFNKRYLNRLTGKIARASFGPFSIIEHVGRKSGKPYQTPIIVIPSAGSFVLALTYGPEVDWYRNVLAAGRCKILWHQQEYMIDEIESLGVEQALPYFPWFERLVLKLVGIQDFVRMKYRSP